MDSACVNQKKRSCASAFSFSNIGGTSRRRSPCGRRIKNPVRSLLLTQNQRHPVMHSFHGIVGRRGDDAVGRSAVLHQRQTSQIHRLIAPLLKEILMLFPHPIRRSRRLEQCTAAAGRCLGTAAFQYGFCPRVDNQRGRQLIAPRLKHRLDAAVFFVQDRHNGSWANLALRHAVLPISALDRLDDLRQLCILFRRKRYRPHMINLRIIHFVPIIARYCPFNGTYLPQPQISS